MGSIKNYGKPWLRRRERLRETDEETAYFQGK